MRTKSIQSPFHLLRYFSITSLLGILFVALVIIYFYSFMVINTINALGEEFHPSIAHAALASVEEDLEQYLSRNYRPSPDEQTNTMPDPALMHAIDSLVNGTGIVRTKIYSRDGLVLYSTNHKQIGNIQIDNPGYLNAIKGEPTSKLIFRDRLNPFDKDTHDENLFQTYLPVIGRQSHQPIGVFEVYSDANGVVTSAAKTQLIVIPVVTGVLLALYFFLRNIVYKANSTIQRQNSVIEERTQTLEVLSAKLLNAQEDERKRMSRELHEGVAQTLFAIKLSLDALQEDDGGIAPMSLAPLIQDAIDRTRELAVKIRPPALDDFGVIETLKSFLQTLRTSHDHLNLEWKFELGEKDLPIPLKTIVFRIAQDTLNSLTRETEADDIQLTLGRTENVIELSFRENAYSRGPSGNGDFSEELRNAAIIPMQERTVLSGGQFRVEHHADGSTENIASWPV